jgi:glucose/arabinose dehydrogenase
MCIEPTTALLIASAASSAMNFQQQKQQAKYRYAAQTRQNQLAKENAIQRAAAQTLKIRQTIKQKQEKGYFAALKAKRARAKYISEAGAAGLALSGSTNALLANFYRQEGTYKASLQRNMNINISQYRRNLEAIQFGQKSQSTFTQAPNSALLFASNALNVANTYYGLEYQKELMGYKSQRQKTLESNQFRQKYFNDATISI